MIMRTFLFGAILLVALVFVNDGQTCKEAAVGIDGAPMALVLAGEFEMGNADDEGKLAERPVHMVYLDAFYMDAHDVTNAQYARFLNEYGKNTDTAGHTLLGISDRFCLIEKKGNTYRPKSGYDNHPVTAVSWYGAAAYAQFYG